MSRLCSQNPTKFACTVFYGETGKVGLGHRSWDDVTLRYVASLNEKQELACAFQNMLIYTRRRLDKGRCSNVAIIGIDVGGTNTDATLISQGRVLAMAKTPTDHANLLASTTKALREILRAYHSEEPVALHLSTTLSTNTIVEGKGEPTAVLAIPGPGVNLQELALPIPLHQLRGYVDHRGREVAPIDPQEVLEAVRKVNAEGMGALAIVGKFSHRNPSQEEAVQGVVRKSGVPFSQITLGHRLSGRSNFPRRIATAYLNSRVARQQLHFVQTIQQVLADHGVIKEVRILKADGGTMSLEDSILRPVETILSGPAASIMAALALTQHPQDNAVVVDIGGTTTDIAVIVNGEPLFERKGAEIAGYRTLVPALFSRSLGLGGDSTVQVVPSEDQQFDFRLGPTRAGVPAALGGTGPTPIDAAVALGLAPLGSRDRAVESLKCFGKPWGLDWQDVAQGIMTAFAQQLAQAIRDIYDHLACVPVYTISEILAPPDIRPRRIIGLGAPAGVFVPLAAGQLGLPWEILPAHAGANAIGAAAARPTASITLHADTEQEVLTVPERGIRQRIPRALLFDGKRARAEAIAQGRQYAQELGLADCDDVYVVEAESFNVVRGFQTVGQIHTIRAQVRPKVYRVHGVFGSEGADSQC